MRITLHHVNEIVNIDLQIFHDITLGIKKNDNVNCYYLDNPKFNYFKNEFFNGSLSEGGSVNCENISLYPHASGTHTECALHVAPVDFNMFNLQFKSISLAKLITVNPTTNGEDFYISENELKELDNEFNCEALILRTLPNNALKINKNYSDTNPCFLTESAIESIKSMGFNHLIVDLPSIDKESDEGKLASHKKWFFDDGIVNPNRLITEFVFVDNYIEDGVYVVHIQAPKIETDAVPSKVLIYPVL